MVAKCIILQARSRGTYEFIRSRNIFHLPTKKILKSYIRKSSGEVGVIELLKKRLTIDCVTTPLAGGEARVAHYG